MIKKLYATFALLVLGMTIFAGVCQANPGSEGKEFYLGFTPNLFVSGQLSLVLAAKEDTTVTVEIPGLGYRQEFSVLANKTTTVALGKEPQRQQANAVSKLGVHVFSPKKISVYAFNRDERISDGYLALPVDALGKEYFYLNYNAYNFSQMLLVGAYDNTKVNVTAVGAKTPLVITLNRGDTYLHQRNGEMSGTHVSSSAPVGVIAALDAALVPHGYSALDYLAEMLPPVSTWGKSFLTVPLATRLKGDLFRIIAAQDNTQVSVNGVLKVTLARGAFYETFLTTRSQITSSAPTLLVQIATGTGYDGVQADPFSMIISPQEQFLDDYTISTPNDSGYPRQFANVVIPSGALGGLQLNGIAVDPNRFAPIGDSGFSGGQVPLAPGTHTFRSGGVPFGIYIYGFGYNEGYGYPGGMSFKAINPLGDPFAPGLRLIQMGDVMQGSATDSEDANANSALDAGEDRNGNGAIDARNEDANGNGKLDTGEDSNANGVLDRDSGIFRVELLADASNLRLTVVPFIPGALAAQFSVTRIDLTKPGMGRIQITDGAGNKTVGPIAIATIPVMRNVRAVATLAAAGVQVDAASFAKAPVSITNGVDRQVIEWHFDTFNADSSADLSFDVVLKNPLGGEKRLVTQQFDLYYTDDNGVAQHTALGPRYVDVMPASFTITPATDKGTYVAGENVHINSTVTSLGTVPKAPSIRLKVLDAANGLVASLGQLPVQPVPVGATMVFGGLDFNVTNIRSGNYQLVAELMDDATVLAIGKTTFAVDAVAGSGVTVAISTDKQVYVPNDNVVLSDRITSLSQNSARNNLRVVTEVFNADGTTRMSKTETVAQLPAKGVSDFRYGLPLAGAAAGTYTATVKVSASDATVLAQATTKFSVSSSADTGSGLVGTITALPARVPLDESVSLEYSVSNLGNSVLAGLPLTVRIIDPVTQTVVAEFPAMQTLAVGATYHAGVNWLSVGKVGDSVVAVLGATVNGKALTLAQSTITITHPLPKLDIRQALMRGSRTLVLLSCEEGTNPAPADCAAQNSIAITKMLTSLGVQHRIVTSEAAFKLAMRSGAYNTYWISGKQDKLHGNVAAEVREAVFGGESLILDGVHDERNKTLDPVAAIVYRGKVGERDLPIAIRGPNFTGQRLLMSGQALKIDTAGGVQEALFTGTRPTSNGPAIVTQKYGNGRAVMFAFDLPASYTVEPRWQAVLGSALVYSTPALPSVITPGALVDVETSVENLGRAIDIQVRTTLPDGAFALRTAPAAKVDPATNLVAWLFPLAVAQTQQLQLTMQVPMTPGESPLSTVVSSVRDGVATPYGAPLSLPITVVGANPASVDVIETLRELPLTQQRDVSARDAALASLQSAMVFFNQNTAQGYESAIDALIQASDQVRSIASADTSAARVGIDHILKETQARWAQLQTVAP